MQTFHRMHYVFEVLISKAVSQRMQFAKLVVSKKAYNQKREDKIVTADISQRCKNIHTLR